MGKFQAVRYHDFSAGHRVVGHENKCRFIHGHNYRVWFYCQGKLDDIGRVVDFGVIKTLLCYWLEHNWDHKLLLWTEDSYSRLKLLDESIVLVPFNPTAENMAQYLVETIGPCQLRDTGILLTSVVVEETRKCSARYEISH